jgi:predicted lipoprotein with Yx(FWY)xxD motif
MTKKLSTASARQSSLRRIAIGAVAVSGAAVLAVTTLSLASGASAAPTTLKVSQNASWGPTLGLKNGDTVYAFSKDARNKSVCTGQCAVDWPPVLLSPGQKKPAGAGVKSLGVIMRANGTHQVTYDGIPLYRFVGDKAADQVNGNITAFGGHWWSINPKSPHTPPTEKSGAGGTGSSGTTTTTPPPTTTPSPTPTSPPTTGIAY